MEYTSDIVIGERYRDTQTGHEGVVTSITFYQHACERVAIEAYDYERKEVKLEVFDAPRLVNANGVPSLSRGPGGPQMPNPQATPPRR